MLERFSPDYTKPRYRFTARLYKIDNHRAMFWPEHSGWKLNNCIEGCAVADRSYFLWTIPTEGADMLREAKGIV